MLCPSWTRCSSPASSSVLSQKSGPLATRVVNGLLGTVLLFIVDSSITPNVLHQTCYTTSVATTATRASCRIDMGSADKLGKAPARGRRFCTLQGVFLLFQIQDPSLASLLVLGPVSGAQGRVKTIVTRCNAEFHMTNARNCSAMNRTGNIVRPGAWIQGTTSRLASMYTRLSLTHA